MKDDNLSSGIKVDTTLDHSSHESFYEYYAEESQSPKTLERFLAIKNKILQTHSSVHSADAVSVADIGCGAGTQTTIWAKSGYEVHGLDVNEPLLNLARQRATEKGLKIDYQLGSADALPWASESMDICLVPELLEHVANWQPCLDEFSRILKPGGLLYISTSNKLCPIQHEFNLAFYSWYPTWVKRYFEKLAITTRPDLANFAKYPAVHWFTFYSLRNELSVRGFNSIMDRFDSLDVSTMGGIQKVATKLIHSLKLMRWLAHVATPYTVVLAIKEKA